MIKKIHKPIVLLLMTGAISVIVVLIVCNCLISNYADGRVFSDINSVPNHEMGLLLGTTPQTRIGRHQNLFFKYRIDATETLFKAGKIKTVLISGDEDSLDGVNEVACMRDSLVARGIPVEAILLDGKGYRTLDSVVRATDVYDKQSYVVISQRFHNERAIYLAEHLGLDVTNLCGYNASDPTSNMAILTYIREYFARVKVFIDIMSR